MRVQRNGSGCRQQSGNQGSEPGEIRYSASVNLPAGEYVVRHTMQGDEHVMVFRRQIGNDEFKVKCTLVPLAGKAPQTQTVYEIAGNDRIVQEMVFRGDKAKHVFEK